MKTLLFILAFGIILGFAIEGEARRNANRGASLTTNRRTTTPRLQQVGAQRQRPALLRRQSTARHRVKPVRRSYRSWQSSMTKAWVNGWQSWEKGMRMVYGNKAMDQWRKSMSRFYPVFGGPPVPFGL